MLPNKPLAFLTVDKYPGEHSRYIFVLEKFEISSLSSTICYFHFSLQIKFVEISKSWLLVFAGTFGHAYDIYLCLAYQ